MLFTTSASRLCRCALRFAYLYYLSPLFCFHCGTFSVSLCSSACVTYSRSVSLPPSVLFRFKLFHFIKVHTMFSCFDNGDVFTFRQTFSVPNILLFKPRLTLTLSPCYWSRDFSSLCRFVNIFLLSFFVSLCRSRPMRDAILFSSCVSYLLSIYSTFSACFYRIVIFNRFRSFEFCCGWNQTYGITFIKCNSSFKQRCNCI